MTRIPDDDSGKTAQGSKSSTDANELDGLVGLGIKHEALRKARNLLRNPATAADVFTEAARAVLTLVDWYNDWASLIEAAWVRLPRSDRSRDRFWMLSFHFSNKNFEAASRFIPPGLKVSSGWWRWLFAMETVVKLGEWIKRGNWLRNLYA